MVIILGDIHGQFYDLKKIIDRKGIEKCFIIQVGDFGIGYYPDKSEDTLRDLDKFLRQRDIILYAIRGNHDDPYYFKGKHILENLKLLPDYTQLDIDGHNFLFVGGAVSIDRKNSLALMQKSSIRGIDSPLYWFDEPFVLDEEKLKDIKGVEIVVTHTAPEYCFPDNRGGFGRFVDNYIANDPALVDDLTEERTLVTKMFEILRENNYVDKHFYGHFHRSEITLNSYTTHQLVGINELVEIENYSDYESIFNERYK